MTAPPFSNLQPGFQRKTPISLPTWILSDDGIFQIEYSLRCGFARWSSPGQATRTRRQEELISRSPNTQTCSRHILRIQNLQLASLKEGLYSASWRGLFLSALVLVWQNIACQSVPQANQSYYTDRFQWTHFIHSDTDFFLGFLKMDIIEIHIRWVQCRFLFTSKPQEICYWGCLEWNFTAGISIFCPARTVHKEGV